MNQNKIEKLFKKHIKAKKYKKTEEILYKDQSEWNIRAAKKELDNHVIVVINQFTLLKYIKTLWKFLHATEKNKLTDWYCNFTKTVFVHGNPKKIRHKYKNLLPHKGKAIAYSSIGNSNTHLGLSKICPRLKTTNGPNFNNTTINLNKHKNKIQSHATIYLSTHNLSFEKILIHLNHLIAEGYISGVLNKNLNSLNLIFLKRKINLLKNSSTTVGSYRISIDETDRTKLKICGYITKTKNQIIQLKPPK